jgi:hypothetical protein
MAPNQGFHGAIPARCGIIDLVGALTSEFVVSNGQIIST